MRIADYAFLLGVLAGPSAWAGPAPQPENARVLGEWMTEDRQGVVRIEPCAPAGVDLRSKAADAGSGQNSNPRGDQAIETGLGHEQTFCGRVVGVSDFPPGGLRDLHGTPQCGLVILHDLKPTEDQRRRGSITNPDDGRVYGAIVWVADDGDLRLRGFVGLPLLGSTQHWPRFTGSLTKDCHFVQG